MQQTQLAYYSNIPISDSDKMFPFERRQHYDNLKKIKKDESEALERARSGRGK